MIKNLNIQAFSVLVIYPLILVALVAHYGFFYELSWSHLIMAVSGYYVSNITVGIGLHRLWSHSAYKANKYLEFVLMVLSAGTLQGPILSWASNHFKHHTYTDTEKDPHTPQKFKDSPIKGFLWSHIVWMLEGDGSYKSIDRVTMVKLGRNEILKFQLKHYWKLAFFVLVILPSVIGYFIGGTFFSAYTVFLFVGVGRALQQQATFCVNSACHFFGNKKYYNGTAGDIWWLALFLLGENWHNFHHAFPSDYRNGVKWYHFDVHKWIIYLFSKIGLAYDLNITNETRIQAKVEHTEKQNIEVTKNKLCILQNKVNDLFQTLQEKCCELESSSASVKNMMKNSFLSYQERLNNLKLQLQQLKSFDSTSEKIIALISKNLKDLEGAMQKLYSDFDQRKKILTS